MVFPASLKPGDTIALVAPASVPERDRIDRFCKAWTSRGFEVRVAKHVFSPNGYLAGTDEQRAADLMDAFMDSTVAAVFAARGGYGVSRMIQLLDFDAIRSRPKIFAGFSDMTMLHATLNRHCGLVTFHAPHANDGLDPSSGCMRTMDSFVTLVTESLDGQVLVERGEGLVTKVAGKAKGRLCGGNLAVLASTIGTKYCPLFAGGILFLEDIGENPYEIDRYLSQLRHSGCLESVAGVLLGHFTNCEPDGAAVSLELEEVLVGYLGGLGVPVLAGVECGHALPNLTLPMGAIVELDSGKKTVEVVGG